MKIEVFGKTWTLTCKIRVEVTILMKTWNDPTVITVILPQPVSHKTPIKVQFLTKVLKSIFPKVWDSFPRQYSIVWRSFCSKFNINSIRTRSKQYQYSEGGGGVCGPRQVHMHSTGGGGVRPPRTVTRSQIFKRQAYIRHHDVVARSGVIEGLQESSGG